MEMSFSKYIGFNGSRYCIQISFKDKFACISSAMELKELYQYKPIRYDDGRFVGNLMIEESKYDTIINITFLLVDDEGKEASESIHEDLAKQFINTQLMH